MSNEDRIKEIEKLKKEYAKICLKLDINHRQGSRILELRAQVRDQVHIEEVANFTDSFMVYPNDPWDAYANYSVELEENSNERLILLVQQTEAFEKYEKAKKDFKFE